MKRTLILCMSSLLSISLQGGPNPFFKEWTTPYGLPPFSEIQLSHFRPAYQAAMAEEMAEIWSIVRNVEAPNFENTILAFDRVGSLLRKVTPVFGGLSSVANQAELQALAREFSPMMSKHRDDILLNPGLFERIHVVYQQKDRLDLSKEELRLLDNTYKRFVRGGANLKPQDQEKLRKLNAEISALQLRFGQHLLGETADYELLLTQSEQLVGLSPQQIDEAAKRAQQKKREGWAFGLDNPSIMPFLASSSDRALRRAMLDAYLLRGNRGNERDNKSIILQLVALRLEKARLMGYSTFAEMAIEDRMSKDPQTVEAFLNKLWDPALAMALTELKDIEKMMKKEGQSLPAEASDWRYYAAKVAQEKFKISEEEVRVYFPLAQVRDGIFYVCQQLWKIRFEELHNVPLPHPEATAWRCSDSDGSLLGIVYLDMHPRPGQKNGGAWCGSYRSQSYSHNERIAPVVTIACNFTRPSGQQPALLTSDEVTTFFHEFGHGLNHLFKDVKFYGTSGTERDFGEFPSQVMEHWAFHPQVLAQYAKHYQSGAPIPASLVDKIVKKEKYGQGFATTEFLAASLLDMAYHTLRDLPQGMEVEAFEKEVLAQRGLPSAIPPRYRSTYFSHTFSGGYTAGYYMYLWAEQLDSDAFEAFLEKKNIFDPILAQKLRYEIFARGGIEDAMVLYKNFRGKDPDVNALLRNRGLK